MDLEKLFNSNKAVSPVIGVVLMVAITVILAAAIGSSVFGQGPAKSAPQANINAKLTNSSSNVTIEHLGGDTIVWDNVQVRFTYENGSTSGLIGITKPSGQFAVGQIETFRVSNTPLPSGEVFNLKITDNVTSQMVCDKKLRT
jgi:flagellin-like protein